MTFCKYAICGMTSTMVINDGIVHRNIKVIILLYFKRIWDSKKQWSFIPAVKKFQNKNYTKPRFLKQHFHGLNFLPNSYISSISWGQEMERWGGINLPEISQRFDISQIKIFLLPQILDWNQIPLKGKDKIRGNGLEIRQVGSPGISVAFLFSQRIKSVVT